MLRANGAARSTLIARFEQEMRAVGKLDHPNVVRAMDAREIDGTPLLVMEFVDGMNLTQLVDAAARCRSRRLGLIRQAALGLQAAHERGLVHRDVKPSNLMLNRQGVLKLLDLGLARFQPDLRTGAEMTTGLQAMGTADYMAPEQITDADTVDIRADIYALGCTFYKLLSGHPPFYGPRYASNFEKMTAHVQQPLPAIGKSPGCTGSSGGGHCPHDGKKSRRAVCRARRGRRRRGAFLAGCDLPRLIGEAETGTFHGEKKEPLDAANHASSTRSADNRREHPDACLHGKALPIRQRGWLVSAFRWAEITNPGQPVHC